MREKALIRYCEKCGRILQMVFDSHHYSMETGEELFTLTYKCPYKEWYNNHTRFKMIDEYNMGEYRISTPLFYNEFGEIEEKLLTE